jgi:hypothetical protein
MHFETQIHPFRLLGDEGGLPMFLAFCWFIDLLFCLWSGWNFFCGAEVLKPMFVKTLIIGIALLFACSMSKDMGDMKLGCQSQYCNYEWYVPRSMIGKYITCPKCKETYLVPNQD